MKLADLGTPALILDRAVVAANCAAMTGRMARLGVRLGVETVFVPALLKAAPVRLRTQLAAVHMGLRPAAPPDGSRVSMQIEDGVPAEYYAAAGYRVAGGLAVRVAALAAW